MDRNLEILARSPFWAIRPEAVLRVVNMLTRTAGIELDWAASKPALRGKGENKMAVIPIQGVLTKDGPGWLGTNYDTISSALEQAATDPTVKRVVLSVDSPGGEVTGLPETAALLAQVAKTKPVSAIVEGDSASAAYWLTSQANEIVLTPSGEVGSVGVRMMHVDMSGMLEKSGYKVTELHAGQFKTEWSPFAPLSDEAKANMQTRLDATHQDFIAAVAAGRGHRATADITAARFGEGRMFGGVDALGHGLVDRLQATRDFYRDITPPEETPQSFGLPRRAALAILRERSKS